MEKVEDYINDTLLSLFHKYILIGGMPAAVESYVKDYNLNNVFLEHKSINDFIEYDIAQYAPKSQKIHIKEIYKLIPEELNSKNKRFMVCELLAY